VYVRFDKDKTTVYQLKNSKKRVFLIIRNRAQDYQTDTAVYEGNRD
jgi:hypothetical protein